MISSLDDVYGFQKEYLESFFTTLGLEDSFKAIIELVEFRKYVPILKNRENEGVMYTVTYIRQYGNASVLYLHPDFENRNESIESSYRDDFFDLFIDDMYICYSEGGGGTTGYISSSYIISPTLPDDISGIEFVSKELGRPFKENSTIIIKKR